MAFPAHTWTGLTRWRADYWNDEQAAFRLLVHNLANANVSDDTFGLQSLPQPAALSTLVISGGSHNNTQTMYYASGNAPTSARELHRILAEHTIEFDFDIMDAVFDFEVIDLGAFDFGADHFVKAELDLVTEAPGAIRPPHNPLYSANDDALLLPQSSILSAPFDLMGEDDARVKTVRVNSSTSPSMVPGRLPKGTRIKVITRVELTPAAPIPPVATRAVFGFTKLIVCLTGAYDHRNI